MGVVILIERDMMRISCSFEPYVHKDFALRVLKLFSAGFWNAFLVSTQNPAHEAGHYLQG